MRVRWASAYAVAVSVALALILLGRLPVGRCQGFSGGINPPPTSPLLWLLNDAVDNLTSNIFPEVKDRFGFCIKDPQKDWDQTFNYTNNTDFLRDCAIKFPDLSARLCTAAEVNFYLNSFIDNGGMTNFLKPNKNCNSSSWVSGCEPGWASRVSTDANVDDQDSDYLPSRTLDSQPCCAGFFCPYGLTCMICAYCPIATLNSTTGRCDPYNYQLPPGKPNHACGSADIWADVDHSGDLFCPAGYYCPSTIQKINCSHGHYCRMGSTYETSCFRSSSCHSNTENQNITIIGALVMAALVLLLFIIYNFSDQILAHRERRQAKSRETASRTAREAVQARERWKAAKNIAIKHAVEIHGQISHTFSYKRSKKQPEPQKVVGLSRWSSDASTPEIEEPSILSNMSHSSEKISGSSESIHSNTGDKKPKKNAMKDKHMHTRTQIFKYAYSEIEKEKVLQQEKKLTFSGVISMARKNEIRTRPLVEISFEDLTLVLKRNKKQLLTSVTGKLIPGHVTAIMGPSGAGKTTFLSALAGRTAGCQMSGLVLINGKVEPIHAHRKIIGFVPQDDIVHGNLTVEENLWFSANCRLSTGMSKAEKVLIVERTIDSLGLQAVRNSLVGTVEKRGISGGQRKRVNVGLEMVMEPSLLILDEPTSGLDSSSSLLLLRALRREAVQGVNICMVVHQPSYTLFNMFDVLILLAKGGLIAYQGPVKKVEEYFAGLEIMVPERVNPPDYFIDILEGIVKPSTSVGVKSNQLPLIWMLHNGYNVPPDMHNELDSVNTSFKSRTSSAGVGSDEDSGAANVWRDLKGGFEEKQDYLEHNISQSKGLANRVTPGKFKQYKYYLGRVSKQRLREATTQAVDYLILGLAGVCLGIITKANDTNLGAAGYTYTVIAVSLLGQIGALRSFSIEKLQYMRERASGMSSLAYFLSKDTIDHFNTVVKPVVYLSMFYFFSNPRSSFADNYIVLFALFYCVTGIGYTFAICFQPSSAQLWSALLPVVLTLIATQQKDSKILINLCYPKWALEAFVIVNTKSSTTTDEEPLCCRTIFRLPMGIRGTRLTAAPHCRYSGVWLMTRCGMLAKLGYNINHWGVCLAVLFLYGFVFRCIAFICLVMLNKK
ncbi:ABC transporter G family member [Musa troglodytarum]|uniref:ABC transporter G family member n=1 Tax=Musa troglodytarum TaxID=320322 RepID=A0A9E7JIC1_9LILI|nr:ABC transporter G family member [Musa troglodytarum]